MHHRVHVRNTDPNVSFWSSYWNPSPRIDMQKSLTCEECLDHRGAELGRPAVVTVVKTLWWVNSWAQVVGCCIQGTTVWRGWGCACMFALSVFPGWSGRRWEGSGVQAQCWVAGWCGWRTCRRGSQKTASSWTLVLETPKQLLLHQDSRPELSWHKRGTRSRILKDQDIRVKCRNVAAIHDSPGR